MERTHGLRRACTVTPVPKRKRLSSGPHLHERHAGLRRGHQTGGGLCGGRIPRSAKTLGQGHVCGKTQLPASVRGRCAPHDPWCPPAHPVVLRTVGVRWGLWTQGARGTGGTMATLAERRGTRGGWGARCWGYWGVSGGGTPRFPPARHDRGGGLTRGGAHGDLRVSVPKRGKEVAARRLPPSRERNESYEGV